MGEESIANIDLFKNDPSLLRLKKETNLGKLFLFEILCYDLYV